MGPYVPSQSADKNCQLGDVHLACVTDLDVAKKHAQWWLSDMKGKMDTQTRKDPGASFVMDGGGPVFAARVA